MLPRILLGVICVAFLTDGVHAQTTHMSAEEKIKELQHDMQSKMQEQMTTTQREIEALKAQQQEREIGRIRLTPDEIAPLRAFLCALE
jgi:hypothetical protein